MKNKKLLFRFGAMVFAIGCFWLSFTSATSFQIKIERLNAYWKSVSNSIVPVHFADNWNDFWWFLYFSNSNLNLEKDECPDGDYSWDPYDDKCEGDSLVPEDDEEQSSEIYYIQSYDGKNEYECKTWVKWFYYNAERGERLRPLDTETWASIEDGYWLTTEGGFYTQCRAAWYQEAYADCEDNSKLECPPDDPDCKVKDSKACTDEVDAAYPSNDWYFGQLKQVYSWQDFGLVMWTKYNHNEWPWYTIEKDNNKVELDTTFIRFDKYPLGFIYDYNGWLWFAWCQINGGQDHQENKVETLTYLLNNRSRIQDLFEPNWNGGIRYKGNKGSSAVDCEKIWTAADSLIKLIIEWLIGMNRESDLWVIWNQSDTKMQYFSSSDINSATLLNYVKQRSEILCRWKWLTNPDLENLSSIENSFKDSSAVCLNFTTSDKSVNSTISWWTKTQWKTLIVKNADVIVEPFETEDDLYYYDMFINGWNLIINENESNTKKFVFTTQWFIVPGKTVSDYENTLWEIYNDDTKVYKWEFSWVWSYIRWNFIVDWHVKGTVGPNLKLNNKYFIYWKFTTRDEFKDLEETFAWRCSNGFVINKAWKIQESQWRYCPPSIYKIVNGEKVYDWHNPYEWASLVVIDQNYDSPLYW